MKVLWLINILLPPQSRQFGEPLQYIGGWIEGIFEPMRTVGIQIAVCTVSSVVEKLHQFEEEGVTYYTVSPQAVEQNAFTAILQQFSPDLVQIFGTETPYSRKMIETADPARTLVHIQGLLLRYSHHFWDGIPKRYRHRCVYKEWLKGYARKHYSFYHAFLREMHADMTVGAKDEYACLARACNVLGRTCWDKSAMADLAPNARYFSCDEVLRPVFYSKSPWQIEGCRPHSIFFSQANSPIKGFHMLVRALPAVKRRFPDVRVYVAGHAPTFGITPRHRRIINTIIDYQGYVQKLITRFHLQDNIVFIGPQNAAQVCEQYLAANLFVSASSIENSSNAIAEAMILGVPVVASRVGGTPSMLEDGREGFLYNFFDTDQLATQIIALFERPQTAVVAGQKSRQRALIRHDPETIAQNMLSIYRIIAASQTDV